MVKGIPIPELTERFFGDINAWPTEPDGNNWTQKQVSEIVQHIHETGDCLFHAIFITQNRESCACAACERRAILGFPSVFLASQMFDGLKAGPCTYFVIGNPNKQHYDGWESR